MRRLGQADTPGVKERQSFAEVSEPGLSDDVAPLGLDFERSRLVFYWEDWTLTQTVNVGPVGFVPCFLSEREAVAGVVAGGKGFILPHCTLHETTVDSLLSKCCHTQGVAVLDGQLNEVTRFYAR